MNILEIQETIRKHITIVKKTIITPGIEAIIAIPKKKKEKTEREEYNE